MSTITFTYIGGPTTLIEVEGWRILTAGTPAEALRLLDQEPIDAVLSDHKMPGMSGVDVLRALLMRNGRAHETADLAQAEGDRTLRQPGILKVKAGLMSLEEVEAVTNE